MKYRALGAVRQLAQANVLLAGVTFLTGIVLAHTLGPNGRGELAKLVLWPSLISPMALFGIHLFLARETAHNPSHAFRIYRLGFRAVMLKACAAMMVYGLVVWVAIHYFAVSIDTHLALFAALIIPSSMWNTFQLQIELGRRNTSTFNFVRYSFVVPYLALVGVGWFVGPAEVVTYLIAFVIAAAFSAITSHLMIARTLPCKKTAREKVRANFSMFSLLSASKRYGISVALNATANTIDKMMVSLFFDTKTMGLYVVAVTIAQLQNIFGEALSQTFFSKVVKNKGLSDIDKTWLALRLRQAFMIYVVLSGLLLISAAPLVELVFGARFSGSVDLLYMLIPAITFISARRPFEEVLKAGGLPLEQARVALITTLAFLIFGGLAAWLGNVSLMLIAFFGTSFLGFVSIARIVAAEIDIGVNLLVFPRPGDLTGMIMQFRVLMRG